MIAERSRPGAGGPRSCSEAEDAPRRSDLGLAIAGSFFRQGPSVSTPSAALTWTTGSPDAGAFEVQFSHGGVDFIRAVELLVSADEGRTFEHRASVPKPDYQATFESWSVQGDELTLVLSIEEETPLSDQWVWPWWTLPWPDGVSRPSIGPGRFLLRSQNGGRRWRLQR